MDNWLILYLLIFICAMVFTLTLTPLFRVVARKCNFLDLPSDNHKAHTNATPLLGGAAMFSGWIICIAGGMVLAAFRVLPEIDTMLQPHLYGLQNVSRQLAFIVAGAMLSVVLGLIDDKVALSASVKFAGQFLVALIAVLGGGVRINCFIAEPWISTLLTLFWIMLLMNSINFFDNMDGLAVGTIAIAMGFFTFIAAMNQQYFIAVFAALNFGICCGFWFYNANPALIFMGDSGSHFLGYLAAIVSAGITYINPESSSKLPIIVPLMILALPLFDTGMVVLIRTWNKKPFWIGDHNHISHRFTKIGLSRKQAVLLVHLMALSIALGALPVCWGDFKTSVLLVLQALFLLIIVSILQFAAERR